MNSSRTDPQDGAAAKLVENEQTKLRANFFNSFGGTCLSAATVTPFGLYVVGNGPAHAHRWILAGGLLILFAAAGAGHVLAIRILKGLKA